MIGPVSPLFIVSDVPRAVAFYREALGFDVRLMLPDAAPFLAIVGRGHAQILLKHVAADVPALPNAVRHEGARWDAFVHATEPDALAAELDARGVTFCEPLADHDDDGLRGFAVADADGYVLFFGRPTP